MAISFGLNLEPVFRKQFKVQYQLTAKLFGSAPAGFGWFNWQAETKGVS